MTHDKRTVTHVFQYIQCGGSAWRKSFIQTDKFISIHPMWRFRFIQKQEEKATQDISIHPMWRFRFKKRIK